MLVIEIQAMSLNVSEILKETKISVSPETFAVISIDNETWRNLLAVPAYGPRMTSPFMIFMDGKEVTLLLDSIDLANIKPGLGDARIEGGYRLLTFDIILDHAVVGFTAEISRILSEAEIPILPLSAFSRDSLLIKQDKLAGALRALGPYVRDIC